MDISKDETRRVEFTEPKTKIGTQEYFAGDIKTLPKDVGDMIVNAGWGKDTETGEQKERDLTPKTVALTPGGMEFLSK